MPEQEPVNNADRASTDPTQTAGVGSPATAPTVDPVAKNRIFEKMLERLFATLVNGPSLNCRPHSSRQRVDLATLSRLKDLAPEDGMLRLLGEERQAKFIARAPM